MQNRFRMNPGEEWITQRRGKLKSNRSDGIKKILLKDILEQFDREEKEIIEDEERQSVQPTVPEEGQPLETAAPTPAEPPETTTPAVGMPAVPAAVSEEPVVEITSSDKIPLPDHLPVVPLSDQAQFLSMIPENARVVGGLILGKSKSHLRLWNGRVIYKDADGDGNGEIGSHITDLLQWFAGGPTSATHRPIDAAAFCKQVLIPSGIGAGDVVWWPKESPRPIRKEIHLPSNFQSYFNKYVK